MRDLSVQPEPLSEELTHASLFRRGRLKGAWARTSKALPYTDAANDSPLGADTHRKQLVGEARLPNREDLRTLVFAGACYEPGDPPLYDDVREVSVEERRVFLHSIETRLVQRMFIDALCPRAEDLLPDNLFSYRRGRGTMDALYVAKKLVARGFRWAAKVDIARFFPSVTEPQIENALRDPRLRLHESLVRLGLAFQAVNVLTTSPVLGVPGWRPMPSPPHLLQGSVVAPMLSNLVGARLLDDPLERCFRGRRPVMFLRYGDDLLVLGRSRMDAVDGRDAIEHFASEAGWKLSHKPGKTTPDARDLRRDPIAFLGLELSTAGVRMAPAVLDARASNILTAWRREDGDPFRVLKRRSRNRSLERDLSLLSLDEQRRARCYLHERGLSRGVDYFLPLLAERRVRSLARAERIWARLMPAAQAIPAKEVRHIQAPSGAC